MVWPIDEEESKRYLRIEGRVLSIGALGVDGAQDKSLSDE